MLKLADRVIDAVGREMVVRREDILAPSRSTKGVAWARMVAIAITRDLTGASWSELGRHFGRDRTTTRHAHQVVSRTPGIGGLITKVKHECSTSAL